MKADIIKAWTFLRENNNSIPDNVLDFMKDAALEKLENKEAQSVDNKITELVDRGWAIRIYNIPKRVGEMDCRSWEIRTCYQAEHNNEILFQNEFEGLENAEDAAAEMFAKIAKYEAATNRPQIKVDEVSKIYEKPMTRELYEGDAIVLEIIDQDADSALCSVKFIKDGMVCTRRISLVETKKEDYV